MTMDRLKTIKKFYEQEFNIEPRLVEALTDFDILTLCVRGASNETISAFLDIDKEYIVDAIHKHLSEEFDGWTLDLHFNPLEYYKEGILNTMTKIYTYGSFNFEHLEEVCKNYIKLVEELNEKWI